MVDKVPADEAKVLHAEVKRLEQLMDERSALMDERDRRYTSQFQSQDEKTSLALSSSKEAVSKAETATEKRFDAVNEFRATLSDQAANLMPRAEADVRFIALEGRFNEFRDEMKREIAVLREGRSESIGKSLAYAAVITFILAVIAIGVAVAALFMKQ